jgi:hypothetical protein
MEHVIKVGKKTTAMGQLTAHKMLLMPPLTPPWMQLMMRTGMWIVRWRAIGLRIWEPDSQ